MAQPLSWNVLSACCRIGAIIRNRHPTKIGKAMQGLTYIQSLYRIEREAKEATPKIRYQLRQERAKPLLDTLRAWLDDALPQVPPQSLTGKALHYLHNHWPNLIRYLDEWSSPRSVDGLGLGIQAVHCGGCGFSVGHILLS